VLFLLELTVYTNPTIEIFKQTYSVLSTFTLIIQELEIIQ